MSGGLGSVGPRSPERADQGQEVVPMRQRGDRAFAAVQLGQSASDVYAVFPDLTAYTSFDEDRGMQFKAEACPAEVQMEIRRAISGEAEAPVQPQEGENLQLRGSFGWAEARQEEEGADLEMAELPGETAGSDKASEGDEFQTVDLGASESAEGQRVNRYEPLEVEGEVRPKTKPEKLSWGSLAVMIALLALLTWGSVELANRGIRLPVI